MERDSIDHAKVAHQLEVTHGVFVVNAMRHNHLFVVVFAPR
jgi:hypothetical protein